MISVEAFDRYSFDLQEREERGRVVKNDQLSASALPCKVKVTSLEVKVVYPQVQ